MQTNLSWPPQTEVQPGNFNNSIHKHPGSATWKDQSSFPFSVLQQLTLIFLLCGLLIQFRLLLQSFYFIKFHVLLLVLFPTLLEISFRKSLPMLINWSVCLFFPSSFRVSGLTLSLIHFELCAEWKQRILYMWLSVFLTSVVEMLFFFLQCILLASLDIFLRHKLSSTEGNGL